MDSIKKHWREWGLFDNGKIPVGHMHSNLLEIALERGVPALLVCCCCSAFMPARCGKRFGD